MWDWKIPLQQNFAIYVSATTATIVGHLLGHPRHLATSIFKNQYVRKLRKFVLKSPGDRSGKWCIKGHTLTIMLHWDMMQSTGAAVCFGIFAKELMWPNIVIASVWHISFFLLLWNIFYTYIRPTAWYIYLNDLCFTTSNVLSLLAKMLNGLSTPVNRSNVHGYWVHAIQHAPSRLMVWFLHTFFIHMIPHSYF